MATVKGPTIGLPSGLKEQGQRVDFREDKFITLIETKGVRLAWSKGSVCPCESVNQETGQPDPNCELCKGTGFLWFRPAGYVAPKDAGDLDAVQQTILLDYEAVVIRGVVVSVMTQKKSYDTLGPWALGSFEVTTRPENRLGYYDRLIALDSVLPFSELATVDTDRVVKLRYPATCVNLVRSVAQEFLQNTDFQITKNGHLKFLPGRGPDAAVRLAVHYDHHPVLIVWEHQHAFRDSLTAFKQPVKTTPQGNPQVLPIQSMARLEFLPFPRDRT